MADPSQNPLYEDGLPIVCAQCFWFLAGDKPESDGTCRGGPPTAVVVGMTRDLLGNVRPQMSSFWGPVSPTKFCGAFKPDRLKALEQTAPNGFLVTPEPTGRA